MTRTRTLVPPHLLVLSDCGHWHNTGWEVQQVVHQCVAARWGEISSAKHRKQLSTMLQKQRNNNNNNNNNSSSSNNNDHNNNNNNNNSDSK